MSSRRPFSNHNYLVVPKTLNVDLNVQNRFEPIPNILDKKAFKEHMIGRFHL